MSENPPAYTECSAVEGRERQKNKHSMPLCHHSPDGNPSLCRSALSHELIGRHHTTHFLVTLSKEKPGGVRRKIQSVVQ